MNEICFDTKLHCTDMNVLIEFPNWLIYIEAGHTFAENYVNITTVMKCFLFL